MAENNHSRRLQLPAPRGVLFDRNLKVLVENQNTFNITLDREQAKGNLSDTLHLLAAVTGADETLVNFLELLIEKHRMPAIFRIRASANCRDSGGTRSQSPFLRH
jgi:penicillin-binding protein 2